MTLRVLPQLVVPFKGKNEETRTIGEKLGVSTLLEGTGASQENHVRIVAELIDASMAASCCGLLTVRLRTSSLSSSNCRRRGVVTEKILLRDRMSQLPTRPATTNAEAQNTLSSGFIRPATQSRDYRNAVGYFDEAIRLNPD